MSDTTRAHPRYPVSISAEINTGQDLFMAQAKNLSMGGVGLELDRLVEDKLLIAISLFLVEDGIEDATSGTLEVQGQLVWIAAVDRGGFEGGVRFAPLQKKQGQQLQLFLARLGE